MNSAPSHPATHRQRLSRWLRLVLPGLVTTVLGGAESRADLIQRPDAELFGTST